MPNKAGRVFTRSKLLSNYSPRSLDKPLDVQGRKSSSSMMLIQRILFTQSKHSDGYTDWRRLNLSPLGKRSPCLSPLLGSSSRRVLAANRPLEMLAAQRPVIVLCLQRNPCVQLFRGSWSVLRALLQLP